MSIGKISDEVVRSIKKKSAFGLPDSPSERGMKPFEIKKAFYAPLVDATASLSAEINRVVEEVNTEIEKVLAEIHYVVPAVSSLSLNPAAGGYKLPKSYQLLKITHRESNAENIAGKLTLKRGTTVLKNDIEPSATAAEVAITDSAVVLTASGITFTLSGVDKKGNAFSKTATVSGYYTAYIGASDNVAPTTAMVQGLTDVNAARLSGTRTVTFTGSEKYIWFCSTVSALSVTSSGFTVPLTSGGTVTVNGQTYYCFRTADKVLAGTHTFVIA